MEFKLLFVIIIGALLYVVYLYRKLATVRSDAIKKMEERRSSFVSIISHQLRTPLSIVKGYLEGLLTGDQGEISDGQREYLDDALKVSRDTIELVNDYLNIVKLDPEKMELHKDTYSFPELVGDEVEKLQTLARASNCELAFTRPDKELPDVHVDKVKIKQVIENILTNSIKYTGGKGDVEISLTERERDILFSCKDNGVGIPEDEQDAVFTKFYRAKNILQKDTVGSGLGLYLARVIVNAHGGKIWFDSSEDSGTTFYFTVSKFNNT